MRQVLIGLCLALYLLACEGGDEDVTPGDTGFATDTQVSTNTTPTIEWDIRKVEGNNVGLDPDIAVSANGDVAIAYFSSSYETGEECVEVENDPKPTRVWHDLKLAKKTASGEWTTGIVDSPLYPSSTTGLSLAYDRTGNPNIAYRGGEPDMSYCGANDAVLATWTGSAWQFETASAESSDSATGDAASDAGFGVGWWTSLEFDPDGNPAILHQDVHFVYLQGDDRKRADAEFSWRRGGWQTEAVDYGLGAGEYGDVIFDAQGRPVVFYVNPVSENDRFGVYAARRLDDGTWETVRIHKGGTTGYVSAALDPVYDEPVVAFYSAPDYGVKIRRLIDDTNFSVIESWDSEIVKDAKYDEGKYASLAFTPSGDMALAYYRCRRYSPDDDACDINDEALVFAQKKNGTWKYETVDQVGLSCGLFSSLAIGSDGVARIAYRCTEFDGREHVWGLFVAEKPLGDSL